MNIYEKNMPRAHKHTGAQAIQKAAKQAVERESLFLPALGALSLPNQSAGPERELSPKEAADARFSSSLAGMGGPKDPRRSSK